MHRQAEFGVAAHWRYKEGGSAKRRAGPTSLSTTRSPGCGELLAWRDEVADGARAGPRSPRQASLDDTIYVRDAAGQGRRPARGRDAGGLRLSRCTPTSATAAAAPRWTARWCRSTTPLASGQRVEIVAAKSGGPSRDWLQPELGFLKSHRARGKVRQWFNAQPARRDRRAGPRHGRKGAAARGRAAGEPRGAGAASSASRRPDDLFAAVARDEVNLRQLQAALRELTRSGFRS